MCESSNAFRACPPHARRQHAVSGMPAVRWRCCVSRRCCVSSWRDPQAGSRARTGSRADPLLCLHLRLGADPLLCLRLRLDTFSTTSFSCADELALPAPWLLVQPGGGGVALESAPRSRGADGRECWPPSVWSATGISTSESETEAHTCTCSTVRAAEPQCEESHQGGPRTHPREQHVCHTKVSHPASSNAKTSAGRKIRLINPVQGVEGAGRSSDSTKIENLIAEYSPIC